MKKLIIVCVVVLTACLISFIVGGIEKAESEPVVFLKYIIVVDGPVNIKNSESVHHLSDEFISCPFLPLFISDALHGPFLLGGDQTPMLLS